MRFYMPTDIYVEKDCVKNHAHNLLTVGKRAFIMTGKTSAKKNGSLNDVTAVLDAGHVPYQIFDQVEENPSTDTVGNAAQQAMQQLQQGSNPNGDWVQISNYHQHGTLP